MDLPASRDDGTMRRKRELSKKVRRLTIRGGKAQREGTQSAASSSRGGKAPGVRDGSLHHLCLRSEERLGVEISLIRELSSQ